MTYSTGSLIIDDDYNIFATGNAAGTGDTSVANINYYSWYRNWR